jgi:hypothetical protein
MVPTAVRFFLGLFEAGLYPGIVFYLSWSVSFAHKVIFRRPIFCKLVQALRAGYPRRGVLLVCYCSGRFQYVHFASSLSAFLLTVATAGGLLAAAIVNMQGVGGKAGWAWIFILEGLFTILCAIASYFIIADFPEHAKFLSETESTCVCPEFPYNSTQPLFVLQDFSLYAVFKMICNLALGVKHSRRSIFGRVSATGKHG